MTKKLLPFFLVLISTSCNATKNSATQFDIRPGDEKHKVLSHKKFKNSELFIHPQAGVCDRKFIKGYSWNSIGINKEHPDNIFDMAGFEFTHSNLLLKAVFLISPKDREKANDMLKEVFTKIENEYPYNPKLRNPIAKQQFEESRVDCSVVECFVTTLKDSNPDNMIIAMTYLPPNSQKRSLASVFMINNKLHDVLGQEMKKCLSK